MIAAVHAISLTVHNSPCRNLRPIFKLAGLSLLLMSQKLHGWDDYLIDWVSGKQILFLMPMALTSARFYSPPARSPRPST